MSLSIRSRKVNKNICVLTLKWKIAYYLMTMLLTVTVCGGHLLY